MDTNGARIAADLRLMEQDADISDGFAEASLMLSSALEQLDDIIAGSLCFLFLWNSKRGVVSADCPQTSTSLSSSVELSLNEVLLINVNC